MTGVQTCALPICFPVTILYVSQSRYLRAHIALYFAIDNDEIHFGDAAAAYSAGPESKTQGIIGPVDLTTPHPEVAARLRTASPRQLFPPFKAEEWFVIIRLEYRFDSEFDDKTQKFLGSLLLSAKSKDSATSLLDSYLPSLVAR